LTLRDEGKNEYRIAVLPGDGIGAEVTAEAEKLLRAVGERFGYRFSMDRGLIGGAAMLPAIPCLRPRWLWPGTRTLS
jgi:isocitrate/isopropylmalate dehydrogenase